MSKNRTGHTLVIGKTMSGKTTIVRKIVKAASIKHNKPVLVLTPFDKDPEWAFAQYKTDDPERFLEAVFKNTGCFVVVDEGGEMAGQFDKATAKLATRGRHNGHLCFFIAQRPTDINVSIRNNCVNLFLFKSAMNDCRELHNIFVDEAIFNAPSLIDGECIVIRKGMKTTRWQVFEM